jgi:hypothetical protein
MAIVGNAAQAPRTPAPPPQRAPAQAPPSRGSSSKVLGSKFADADGQSAGGNWLKPQADGSAATYQIAVSRVFMKAKDRRDYDDNPEAYLGGISKNEKSPGESFIIEFEVLASDCPACPVGAQLSHVIKDRGRFDYYENDTKSFICAVFGVDDPKQVDGSDTFAVVSEKQAAVNDSPNKGRVNVVVRNKVTEAGKDFTNVIWSAAE